MKQNLGGAVVSMLLKDRFSKQCKEFYTRMQMNSWDVDECHRQSAIYKDYTHIKFKTRLS